MADSRQIRQESTILFSLPNTGGIGGGEVEIDRETTEEILAIEEYGKLYKVIIHNDHFTSMDFVVKILIEFFDKSFDDAHKIMMYVHKNGFAVAGAYSKEIAETKISLVKKLAEENEFPLMLTMERVI